MWVQLVFVEVDDVDVGDGGIYDKIGCVINMDEQWVRWVYVDYFIIMFEFLWWYGVVCKLVVYVGVVEQVVWMCGVIVLIEIVGCGCCCELLCLWFDWNGDYVLFELFVIMDVCIVVGGQNVDKVFFGYDFKLDFRIGFEEFGDDGRQYKLCGVYWYIEFQCVGRFFVEIVDYVQCGFYFV